MKTHINFIVPYELKTGFQKLVYQLHKYGLKLIRDSFIAISKSIVKIRLKCNDLWTPLLEILLQPIDKIKFEICLDIAGRRWFNFINAFAQVFEPLSSQGSRIDRINISLNRYNNKNIKYIEVEESLKLLRIFKVGTVHIDKAFVTEEMFKMLAEEIQEKQTI